MDTQNKGYGKLIGIAIAVLLVLIAAGDSCSWYSTANKLTNATEAAGTNSKNIYDNGWKSVTEVAQVPGEMKEAFKEVLVGAKAATYGSDGAKAAFLWIQEQNPGLPTESYNKVQTVIEVFRKDFMRAQQDLQDRQRKLKDHLGSPRGMFYTKIFDFPREMRGANAPARDLDGDGLITCLDFPVVTSAKTEEAFRTGQDEQLDVFGKNKK